MNCFVLTPQAEQDLIGIWEYVAQDSLDQADRVVAKIQTTLEGLVVHPFKGHVQEDWADRRHRFWRVYNYIIMYRPETKPLQVLRIISGYRDLANILKN